ncbi:uncharacterized protein [Haliotis asinina]|uniref:uncharacterized protein n=1 Tax=Haliotis asinina TaxID=109174 RepID=UPI0035321ED0
MEVSVLWVLLCISILDIVSGICPEGTYGYECGYQCHCPLVKCNATSGCRPGDCDTGWSGVTCNKRNIALNKPTSSSSIYQDPGNAVNGDNSADNYGQCFSSDWRDNLITEAWWRVDLEEMVRVRHVTIYFRKDYKVRRNGIQIYIADTAASPADGVNCHNVIGNVNGTDIPDVLTVSCSGEGRYLVLYTTTVNNELNNVNVPTMDFCEVEVDGNCPAGEYGYSCSYQCHCPQVYCNATSGCQPADCSRGWSGPSCQKENIALNRTTSASSIYMASSRAVDGGKGGILSGGSCFHSAYTDFRITSAWWRVDLGQETLVHDVSIYFRTDYIVRRSGIQIYIADTDGSPTDGINCYTVSGTDIPDVLNATCTGEGRYLVLYTTVKSTGDSVPIMDFCEVEVEVCARGTFGADCDNYCHCDGDVCNYVTGVCPSGTCLPGWRTDRCDTACVQGTEYGVGCLKTCSSRMCHGDASTCPQDTGRCTEGCQAGWKGEDCTTACVQGTEYGVGCLKTCSSRMCHGDVSTCPQDTGRCTGGCQAGWKGEDCTTACVQGTEYGVGCLKTCSSRMCHGDASTCPQDTGRCTGGCQAGWKGEDCTTACVQGTEYGVGCLKTCSSRMCHGDVSTCPQDTGRCTGGCQAGWKGEDCTTACVQGTEYGVGCLKTCSSRMCHGDVSTCPQDTGRCTGGCQAGWKGEDCTTACVQGTEYGVGCLKTCSSRMCHGDASTCPQDTGRCTGGCQAGWKGEDCTTACVQGTEYGVGCLKTCSSRMCHGDLVSKVRSTGLGVSKPAVPGCAMEMRAPVPRIQDGVQEDVRQDGRGRTALQLVSKVRSTGLGVSKPAVPGCAMEILCPRYGVRGWVSQNLQFPDVPWRCEHLSPGYRTVYRRMSGRMEGLCPRYGVRGWVSQNLQFPDVPWRCEHLSPGYRTVYRRMSGRMEGGGLHYRIQDGVQEDVRQDGRVRTALQLVSKVRSTGLGVSKPAVPGCAMEMRAPVPRIQDGVQEDVRQDGRGRTALQGAISTCPRETGRCTEGCEAGWKGEDCTTEVSMPLSTGPAVISGVVVAAIAIVAIGVVVVVFLRRRNHRKQSDNHTKIHKEDTDETGVDNPAPVLGEDEDNVEEDHNATYYNIGFAPAVTVVSVDQLGERIKELQVPAGGFQAEYQKLPTIFTRPYTDSQREENKGKNKYISYYPYDATRVVLKELPDQPGSDYINASYIDGYSRPKAYIAAQAPNKKTLTEFWRMIWEQNCTRIVMLTNMKELGRVKCEAYWSDTTDLHVDDFIITVTDSSIRANWVVREVQVTDRQTNTSRCFYHFHFTTWPDHGTPEEMALTEFLWLVRSSYITQDDPLLVHCSAGVGRTGTYIALDYLLDQALAENAVDVLGCVSGIRDQRKGMIQTKEQYTCLYMALYDALQFGNTAITIDEFRNNRNVKGTFSTCRMSITKFIETQNTQREKQSKGEHEPSGRVWINGRSDILAIRLRSHLSMQGYLLTEAPSVITASLFWKLTEEQESSTVIVLPDSHQCLSSFVPSPGDSLDLGPVTVTCSTEIPVNTNVTLLNTERQMENSEPTHVRVYILNILPAQSPSTFLELLEELDRHTGDVNPNTVTVVYSDGGRQNAAMLCILSNIVQGLKYDKRAEIYNNMRAMVHCLDQDITQDDVALCYDVAAIYLESQNIYANL